MGAREMTLSDVERLRLDAEDTDVAFEMDEEAFRAFYDRTARALWAYLCRITGNPQQADDLLQESYYRFLRARAPYDGEAHRRNALFRIATNLVKDSRRRMRGVHTVALPEHDGAEALVADADVAARTERRTDLARAMQRLRPKERALLWLAYAHGSSHHEIAGVLGLKSGSVRLLLFRARRKLALLLRGARAERRPEVPR